MSERRPPDQLYDLLTRERARPAARRTSRTTDKQLDTALAVVEAARAGTAPGLAQWSATLARMVGDEWPYSAFGATVLGLAQAVSAPSTTSFIDPPDDGGPASLLTVLDRSPGPDGDDDERAAWWHEVDRSLRSRPHEWVRTVGPRVREDGLTAARAWALLGWVETGTIRLGWVRGRALAERAVLALALLESSPLDRRDVMVVASRLRRTVNESGRDFDRVARRGCGRADALGESCIRWLRQVPPAETDDDDGTQRVLPRWVRYPLFALLAAVLAYSAVVAVQDGPVMPLLGPPVAAVVSSLLVLAVFHGRTRRDGALYARLLEQLQALMPVLAHERSTPAPQRATGGDDTSLTRAGELADLALQRLAWGHHEGAVPHLLELDELASTAWRPESHLAQVVQGLAVEASEVRRLAERRRRADLTRWRGASSR